MRVTNIHERYANILSRSGKVRRSEGAQKGSMPTIVLEMNYEREMIGSFI
jgi:hypothetical protein